MGWIRDPGSGKKRTPIRIRNTDYMFSITFVTIVFSQDNEMQMNYLSFFCFLGSRQACGH
jgi:hypothetical protein